MCGRFVLFTTDEQLFQSLPFAQVHTPVGLPRPRYNIAPTTPVPIVRAQSATEATVEPARWGLVPGWKRELTGPPLFNARAETVSEKPSFRSAFKTQRCAIPMDGYYEWKDKQPHWITTGSPLWVAGLWDTGLDTLSTTMITTEAREPLDQVHHRMPRFLAPEEIMQWLLGTPEEAAELLTPADPQGFRIGLADPAVGNVRNDDPALIQPAGLF